MLKGLIAKQAMLDEGEHCRAEESVLLNSGDCMMNYDFMNESIPSSLQRATEEIFHDTISLGNYPIGFFCTTHQWSVYRLVGLRGPPEPLRSLIPCPLRHLFYRRKTVAWCTHSNSENCTPIFLSSL